MNKWILILCLLIPVVALGQFSPLGVSFDEWGKVTDDTAHWQAYADTIGAKADTADIWTLEMFRDTTRIGVDTSYGTATGFDQYIRPAFLREGANITFAVVAETLTITGSAGGSGDDVQADTGAATVDLSTAIITAGPRGQVDVAGNVVTIFPDSSSFYSLAELKDEMAPVIEDSLDNYPDTSLFHKVTDDTTHWNEAYSWGNHALGGYLTSETGDISGITAGNGLVGGGSSGAVTIDVQLSNWGGLEFKNTDSLQINLDGTSLTLSAVGLSVTSDDDVPEAGDFGALTAGSGLSWVSAGNIKANVGLWGGLEFMGGNTDSLGVKINGTSLSLAAGGLSITDEYVQDLIGAMTTGNTETNITVTYQDADGTIDFEVTGGGDDVWIDTLQNGEGTKDVSKLFIQEGRMMAFHSAGDSLQIGVDPDSFYTRAQMQAITDSNNFNLNDYDNSTIDTSTSGDLRVKAGGITDNEIATGAVKNAEIADGTIDSVEIANDGLSLDDIGWRYEYIYLDMVHGWGRPTVDSTFLSFPIMNGTSAILYRDSAYIVATPNDTVMVSGGVPFDCTIDSLEFCYKVVGTGAKIDFMQLFGPDKSTYTDLVDSSYYALNDSTTDRTSTSWAIVRLNVTPDIVAVAGYRYGLRIVNAFTTDNTAVYVGWVRLKIRR